MAAGVSGETPAVRVLDLRRIDNETQRITVRDNVDIVRQLDGTIRVDHLCATFVDPDDGASVTKRIAPSLTPGPGGHKVVTDNPLTVRPSIHCPDCGLHGFLSAGKWREA